MMTPTKVLITLANGKVIPAIKYESDKFGTYAEKAPLIIYLSGRGQQLNDNVTISRINAAYTNMLSGSQSSVMNNAERFGFKVIVPLFVLEYNNWQPDFTGGTYPRDTALWAIANMDIDPLRMIVYGWSSGGNGTFYAATSALEIANMWAAIVPIASGGVAGGWQNIKTTHLPVWLFHSKDDSSISMGTANDNIKALEMLDADPEPRVTIFDTGGHSGAVNNAGAYAPLFEWMAVQRSNYVPDIEQPPVPPVKTIVGKFFYVDWELIIYNDGSTEKK